MSRTRSALRLAPILLAVAARARADWPTATGDPIGLADNVFYRASVPVSHGNVMVLADTTNGGFRAQLLRPNGTLMYPGLGRPVPSVGLAAAFVADRVGGVVVGGVVTAGLAAEKLDSLGGPTWFPSTRYVTALANVDQPANAVDATDAVWFAYTVTVGDVPSVMVNRLLANGDPDPSVPSSGRYITPRSAGQHAPRIQVDGNVGVFVEWTGDSVLAERGYVLHLGAGGTPDPAWPPMGILYENISAQEPHLVPAGDGGVIVVWVRRPGDGTRDVRAQHFTPNGTIGSGWPSGGLDIGDGGLIDVASDGSGGLLVAWTSHWPASGPARLQHILASGVVDPSWPASGATPLGAYLTQSPRLLRDSGGGLSVAGVRPLTASLSGIFAQRLPIATTPSWVWAADGVSTFVTNSSPYTTLGVDALSWDGGGLLVVANDNGAAIAARVDSSGFVGAPEPPIPTVVDISPDQGGRVELRWMGSYLESQGLIDGYRLEQGVAGASGGPWTLVADVPWPKKGYAYFADASTTVDSSDHGNPLTPFRVIAHGSGGQLQLVSPTGYGYSRDNIAPAPVRWFGGVHDASDNYLSWRSSAESDLSRFRLYRATDDFPPLDADHLVFEGRDSSYADIGTRIAWYQVTEVDVHGNEGSPTALASGNLPLVAVLPKAEVHVASLADPWPSPARDHATIRFGVPRGQPAAIEVFGVDGRLACSLFDGAGSGAERATVWDLRDARGGPLPSGLYFVRLTAPGVSMTRRLLIVR